MMKLSMFFIMQQLQLILATFTFLQLAMVSTNFVHFCFYFVTFTLFILQ